MAEHWVCYVIDEEKNEFRRVEANEFLALDPTMPKRAPMRNWYVVDLGRDDIVIQRFWEGRRFFVWLRL